MMPGQSLRAQRSDEEMAQLVVYWILAVVILGAALAMVLSKNLVHSALFMVVTFIGVAGIYLMLSADFLAAMQILVYVGAISVLLVFGVMLTRRGDIAMSNLFNKYKIVAGVICLGLFLILERLIMTSTWQPSIFSAPESTVGPIADLLMTKYVVPFEVAALLLLVAMVGAILVAKGVKQSR